MLFCSGVRAFEYDVLAQGWTDERFRLPTQHIIGDCIGPFVFGSSPRLAPRCLYLDDEEIALGSVLTAEGRH